jgi:chromate transporter
MKRNVKRKDVLLSVKRYGELFMAFFRIGALTFGGGYAMLPMIEHEVVERYGWASSEEVLDYYAIGQCTPGVIAVNTATFIGRKQAGIPGAIVATAGVITPSLIIILLIASVLENFMHLEIVNHAFAGIRVAVAALIVQAVIKLSKTSVVDWICVGLAIASFLASFVLNASPIFIVLAAGLVGVISRKFFPGVPKFKKKQQEGAGK